MKNEAEKLFKQGFTVIPTKNKKPLVDWKELQDKPQTQELFEKLPWNEADGFSVLCGKKLSNNLFLGVVDFDVKNLSEEAVEKGREAIKHLPITWTEETPSGGRHYIYFCREKPETISAYHNDAAIEVLGEKKLCVMSPSLGYKRLNDNPATVVTNLNVLVEKALERVGVSPGRTNVWFDVKELHGKHYVGKNPPCIQALFKGVSEGLRNEVGIRLASYLLNFRGYKPKTVEKLLKTWNTLNRPPLPGKELTDILKSAIQNTYNFGCRDPILRKYCKREECPIAPKVITKLLTDEEKKKARELLEDPNILGYVVNYGKKMLIGEDDVLLINFIELCSGQTKYPISGMIEGYSGSGKNQSLRAIKPLIPPEWIFEFTTSTPEAIKYIPEDFCGTLLIYEAAGMQSKTGTLGLRAIGEGESIETIYPMRDEATGKMTLGVAKTNAKNFITTESDVDINPDLYRRVFRVSMNHSVLLTKRVIGKKLRDAQIPESLRKLLKLEEHVMPYSEEDFQNALRLQNWKAEVIVFGSNALLKLLDLAVTTEQKVALRTHVDRVLNFVRVLALINQARRIRIVKDGEVKYVIASPEDWFLALNILSSALTSTITRLGKRQMEVLRLFEITNPLNKNDVAESLGVSTSTAYRTLKSLTKNGYLKEDKSTQPYRYELLRKSPKQLGKMENQSEYCLFFRESLRKFLNSTSATFHFLGMQVLGVEDVLKSLEKRYTEKCKVEKVPFTSKQESSGENKQFPFAFSSFQSRKQLENEKREIPEFRKFVNSKVYAQLKSVTRLTTNVQGECAVCGKVGRMSWQGNLFEGGYVLFCGECGEKVLEKKREEGGV